MKGFLKENTQVKHLFRTNHCLGCNQIKVCGKLNPEYCCPCFYQMEQAKAQAHNSYEEVLATQQIEREKRLRQLQLLKSYRGCKQCRSKEIDAYWLYEENRLVCWACLVKKEGSASSPISFLERQKWYRKHWKVDLGEWLEKYQRLPVNKNCADKWRLDKEHLSICQCLEVEAQELYLLFANSLQEMEEKLKECQCARSEKVRVDYLDSEGSGWIYCEKCEKRIESAGHHGVIKNRNDPKFWGIECEWKILCLECIGKGFYKEMEEWQRKKFREYIRRGYI